MKAKMYWMIGSLIGLTLLVGAIQRLHANEFYQGKTIRFVVGFAAGGGYDLSARIVGRHMAKHIPGHPTIVVENMTGAGSLIAANYTYNGAKPDGLFVGIWNRKEVDGGCWTWESARTTARPMLDANGDDKLIPFLIHSREPDPEVKDLPLIPEVFTGPDDLSAYRTWSGTYEFQRPFSVPPGTPKDRLHLVESRGGGGFLRLVRLLPPPTIS